MKNKYLLILISVFFSLNLLLVFSNNKVSAAEPGCYARSTTGRNIIYELADCGPAEQEQVSRQSACYVATLSSQGLGPFTITSCDSFETRSRAITNAGNRISADAEGGTARENLSGGECEPTEGEQLSSENCGIVRIVVNVINFLSAVAGIALIASLMISGFTYMTARDNAGQVEKAKSRIVQTVIALALFIFMYALLNFLVPGGLGLG